MVSPVPTPAPPTAPAGRLPRSHVAIAALVLVTAAFAAPPLQDAATGEPVGFARLVQPLGYLIAAPLFGVWDTLSLLTLSQHYAVLATLVALYIGHRTRARRGSHPLFLRVAKEVGLAAGAVVALLLFYLAGVLLPRPMVGIEIDDPDLVAIDFHSHTSYSHDGWSLFTPARNRAWHEAGGFDVAYVTDHYTWAGYDGSVEGNPERAGDGLTLLSGAEIRIHQRPTNILGHRDRYLFALDGDSVYMEPDSLHAAYARDRWPPTLLYTMPGGLEWVVPFSEEQPAGVIAIEINDGSPRGLEQVKRERAAILALADSANLAVIGAANLHGWGRTVASWSVMEIHGWQHMSPDRMGEAIEAKLHADRREAVTVVERRMPYHHGSSLGVVLTLPWIALEHFRMLGATERISWLLWLAVLATVRMIRPGTQESVMDRRSIRPGPSTGRATASLMLALVAAASGCATDGAVEEPEPLDVLITGARVVDGAGNPWFRADVGIVGDRIAAVGHLSGLPATRVIDAADRVVSPGFIDMMGQSSEVLVTDPPSAESKLRQGITTYLSGEGGSPAPQSDETQPRGPVVDGEELRWHTYAEYFAHLERLGIPINVVHDVGLTQVRRVVLGDEDVRPTPAQLEEMKALVRQAMEDGAVGVSTSLIYPPAIYASTEELTELARVAGEYGGVYFTHMRNESHAVLDAIREALTIGRGAGVPVHIYHLKAAGRENWPLMVEALALIDSARAAGMDVTADIYPYVRNGIGLGSFLHPRHFARGEEAFLGTLSDPSVRAELRREVETTSDWENWYRHVGMDWDEVLIVSAPGEVDARVINRSVAEAAEILGTDSWNAFFDLVQADGVSVNPRSMNEEQKWQALAAEYVMIDTDASPVNPATSASAHPRAFGAFPRVIARYVREDGVLSLEDAVRRMTSLAAHRLGLHDRGLVAPGMAADLLVFDPEQVRDVADFGDAMRYAEGMDYVFVNGVPVIDDGVLTTAAPGRLLKRSVSRQP